MRLPALVAVLLAGCAGSAQEPAPAVDPVIEETTPARVALAIGTEVEGEPGARELQGTVFDALARFGLRLECLAPFREAGHEQRAREEAELAVKEAQPIALRITGQATATYADSAFYGQPLAHNFHGKIEVVLADGEGNVLRTIAFSHSWGRLIQSQPKEATRRDWEDAVHTTVLVGLLSHERVMALIPEAQRADARALIAREKERILRRLERSCPGSEAAQQLQSW